MKDEKNLIKQRKFLDEYAKTLDIKASMITAGYNKQTAEAIGRKLLKNPAIIRELKAIAESKAAHFEITKAYLVSKYVKILEWASSYADGGAITEPQIAIRILDTLLKHLTGGIFTPQPAPGSESPYDGTISSIFNNIKGLDPNKL